VSVVGGADSGPGANADKGPRRFAAVFILGIVVAVALPFLGTVFAVKMMRARAEARQSGAKVGPGASGVPATESARGR
jgi:ABC-type Na+ efflux pump permease subunit